MSGLDKTIVVNMDQCADLYRLAFSQLHDPDDWKAPIDAVVPDQLANVYAAAIEFMTATVAERHSFGNSSIRLIAKGYRQGPAGG